MSSANTKREGSAVHGDANPEPAEPPVELQDVIDDDIQHTVGRLLHVRPQQNNLVKGKKESMDTLVSRTLQAERNHWKERLHMSMLEIDRQHRVILATQTGLQELVGSLRHTTMRRSVITVESDGEDVDQEVMLARLIENLKFQVRQLKVRAGIADISKAELEEQQNRQKQNMTVFRDTITRLELERDEIDKELFEKTGQMAWLQKDNASLRRQVDKLQKIITKYNETHSGANFHLNIVEKPVPLDKRNSALGTLSTMTLETPRNGTSSIRERTYVEGDQLTSYPLPQEEAAIVKDRLRKNIYSVRKGDLRSSTVAQCLRCQSLFRPAENNHKSCQFHHKGREIKEQFDEHGKLEQVVYKWACCKKSLDAPGCCTGYHV